MADHEVGRDLALHTDNEKATHGKSRLAIRHSRAGENPGLFNAELAWISAFAGMTDPTAARHP
jgi:hypothetical protein